MDESTLMTAFSLSPAIVCNILKTAEDTFGWVPSADLTAGTKYTVTISTAAKDVDGKALANAYSSSFTTKATSEIGLTFTRALGDDPATEEKFSKGFEKLTEPSAYFDEAGQKITLLAYGDNANKFLTLTLFKTPVVGTTYGSSDCGAAYQIAYVPSYFAWHYNRGEPTSTIACMSDTNCVGVCTVDPYNCPPSCTDLFWDCREGNIEISLSFTKIGAVGETVEGSFSFDLPRRDIRQKTLSATNGKFCVKRIATSVW